MASPPETSIWAVSAAHANRKLAATTAAPKISRAATAPVCMPVIRTATAGATNAPVISPDRVRVRRRQRAVVATAAGLSMASIVILRRRWRS